MKNFENLKLLEKYEEVVESNASGVSYLWKILHGICYLSAFSSSYICSIFFITLWQEICSRRCLIWAEVVFDKQSSLPECQLELLSTNLTADFKWTRCIIFHQTKLQYCNFYLLCCLLSFVAAFSLFSFIIICGRGGRDTHQLFVSSWRLVVPSIVLSTFLAFVTCVAANMFLRGHGHFSQSLYQLLATATNNETYSAELKKPWKALYLLSPYLMVDKVDDLHQVFATYVTIEVCSYVMVGSWIMSIVVMFFRVLTAADFNIVKVKIYELPEKDAGRKIISAIKEKSL